MSSIRTRLHPFHDISEHNKISLYSLDTTGVAGQLVKIATGSANPQSTQVDGFSSTPNGVSVNGVYSNVYENKWKVSPTVSGDSRFNALGVTLLSTAVTDENGFPLKFSQQRAKQIGAVVSGETVPVATAGMIGLWGKEIDQSLGAVQPGHLAVVSRSGDGRIAAIAPTSANFAANYGAATTGQTAAQLYNPSQVVGKFLSSLPTAGNTGAANEFSAQGGYAFLLLNCSL